MELMYSKWALRVVCNTILDYGVHVLGMSQADAMELLTREAFQSETEAKGKWRRVQLSSVQLTFSFAGFSAIYASRQRLKDEYRQSVVSGKRWSVRLDHGGRRIIQ